MKICSTCNKELDTLRFSKRSASPDGFSYICKSCASKYKKENAHRLKKRTKEEEAVYRKNNRECIRKANRNYRNRNKDRLNAKAREKHATNHEEINRRKSQKRLANKDQRSAYQAKYRAENKEKIWAHHVLNLAVKKGEITKHDLCEKCGSDFHVVGHHPDYRRPLEVIWMCQTCHMRTHSGVAA